MNYPENLISISGEKIKNREDWEKFRSDEIRGLFTEYVYGRCPVDRPNDITFSVTDKIESFFGRNIMYNEITISFSGYSFKVKGFIPVSNKKVPAFVYIMHEFQEEKFDMINEPNNKNIPVFDITERGYAVFIMPTSGIYPDWGKRADYRDGVFRVLSPDREARRDDDWATISAWAWGASRVVDYLLKCDSIDFDNIAVVGHSRSGKTALWCGANDKRISLAISNASGCMGASMLRGKTGEHIKDINVTDWFCGNFKKFNDSEEMLPVDQHMLLALIAPRLLYVASCSEDEWADPVNERLACRLASEVYEKIYDMNGAVLPEEPVDNDRAYHD